MHKAIATVMAFVGLSITTISAHAQPILESEKEPIASCADVTGKWYNEIDVWVNLTIRPSCTFQGASKARSIFAQLMMGRYTIRFSGAGYVSAGELVLPFERDGKKGNYYRFKWRHGKLSGTVTIEGEGTSVIELNPRDHFPVDLR